MNASCYGIKELIPERHDQCTVVCVLICAYCGALSTYITYMANKLWCHYVLLYHYIFKNCFALYYLLLLYCACIILSFVFILSTFYVW